MGVIKVLAAGLYNYNHGRPIGAGRMPDMAGPFIGLSANDGLELRSGKWLDI